MSSIKKSEELVWLLDYAREKYGAGEESTLICESVLLAAIDAQAGEVDTPIHGRERFTIYRILRGQFPGLVDH